MTPITLAIIGGSIALLIWSLSATRVALGRAACVLALLVSAHLGLVGGSLTEPEKVGSPSLVQAVNSAGQVVQIDVVFRAAGKTPRSVRRLGLTRPVAGSGWSLFAMGLIGLVGLIVMIREDEKIAQGVLVALIASGAGMLWVGLGGPEAASGASGVRDYLTALGATQSVESFSVPDGGWTYPHWGIFPALLVCSFSCLAFLPRIERVPWGEELLIVCALGVLSAAAWNAAAVGGFVWSGLDGALSLQGIILAVGVTSFRSGESRGYLLAASAALAILAV